MLLEEEGEVSEDEEGEVKASGGGRVVRPPNSTASQYFCSSLLAPSRVDGEGRRIERPGLEKKEFEKVVKEALD